MRKKAKNVEFPEPILIEGSVKLETAKQVKADYEASDNLGPRSSTYRRNRASTISRTDKYANIEGGVIPFTYSGGQGKYTSTISIRDAIILCQKAYYNFAIFRNTIDLMTEFSCSPIYFTGGNAQSLKFFQAWGEKINLWKFQDMFFREFFRSGNVFVYKLNALFSKEEMMLISEVSAAKQQEIPVRYIILNPADIQSIGSASFVTPRYVKVLNDFEMQVLTNPQTDEDKQLAKRIQDFGNLKTGVKLSQANQYLVFYLDPDRVKGVFYKKQDYEPFSVPMGFPVLEDINWKQELKNIDMAISRTVQQAILLVTMGNDEIGMPSKDQINNLKNIFLNESVGRILVTDYTTQVKFVIPEIDKILGPQKYEVVDRDIRYGLNNILVGEEKYANSTTKVQVFVARLKHARESFLRDFLIPEMKNISKKLGFKSIPTPRFENIDFRDEYMLSRIYARLVEFGALTPEEGITAIETGRLPLPEESVESQKRLSKLQDEGLYQPMMTKAQAQLMEQQLDHQAKLNTQQMKAPQNMSKNMVGRPAGTGEGGGVNIRANEDNYFISAEKVAENLAKFDILSASIEEYLKSKYKKKKISKEQKEIVDQVAETIATNEEPVKWLESIASYVNSPVEINDNTQNIDKMCEEHSVDRKTAIVLFHSKVKK
jgi:hypothetical protein